MFPHVSNACGCNWFTLNLRHDTGFERDKFMLTFEGLSVQYPWALLSRGD